MRASVPSSSAPVSREYPATSAAKIVVSLRCVWVAAIVHYTQPGSAKKGLGDKAMPSAIVVLVGIGRHHPLVVTLAFRLAQHSLLRQPRLA
jgi:hypothetical protein